jgi:hypothetical protein
VVQAFFYQQANDPVRIEDEISALRVFISDHSLKLALLAYKSGVAGRFELALTMQLTAASEREHGHLKTEQQWILWLAVYDFLIRSLAQQLLWEVPV